MGVYVALNIERNVSSIFFIQNQLCNKEGRATLCFHSLIQSSCCHAENTSPASSWSRLKLAAVPKIPQALLRHGTEK